MKKEELKKEIKTIIIEGIFCNDDYGRELGERYDELFTYGHNNIGYINETLILNFPDLTEDEELGLEEEEILDLIEEVWDKEISKIEMEEENRKQGIIKKIKEYLLEAYRSELAEEDYPPSTRSDIILNFLNQHGEYKVDSEELRGLVDDSDDLFVRNDEFYYEIYSEEMWEKAEAEEE
jgi:hypothetical protein